MKLEDIKFGTSYIYYCSKHATQCVVVGSHCDDGAALFIELIKDNDLTSKYRLSEACHLTDNTEPQTEVYSDATSQI